MTRPHRHRARPRLPLWAVLLPVAVGLVLFGAALTLRLAEPVAAATPGRTVTVTRTETEPGPTTTVSYLIEVTVTPGRNGY